MNLAHLLASLEALYEVQRAPRAYSGIIIALAVPGDAGAQVAVEGGTPVDELHVTLAYLGNVEDHRDPVAFLRLARQLSALAASHRPLTAKFGGPGKFLGVAKGNDAAYLSVDSPGLPELRAACVEAARGVGLPEDQTHGFTPHVTVTYQPPGTPHPREQHVGGTFEFAGLGLWIGGNRVTFPFRRVTVRDALHAIVNHNFGQPLAKADSSEDPRAQARALLAQLGGDLRRLDAQDAALVARTGAIQAHHTAAFEGLTRAIPAARGSALEEAALHHAGEAGGARRATA